MKYRWKLLLLLLAITVPMAAFMPRYASRQMDCVSEEISSWAQKGMEQFIGEDLQDSVTGISTALSFAGDNLRIMLRFLTRRVLDGLNSDGSLRPVYWVNDMVSGTIIPPGMRFDEQHWRLRSDGGRDRLRVSWLVPSFWAPDQNDVVRRQARQLAGMGDDLAYAFDNASISYLSIGVVLESGLHMVYPAQGWNPQHYDARGTEWYQAARRAQGVFWDGPVLDPSTGRTCSVGVVPLRDDRGDFRGAICVYLPVGFYERRLVEGLSLPEDTIFYLVTLVSDTADRGQLYIVQRSDGLPTPREGEHLVSEDAETYAAMLEDMKVGKSGVRRMEYRGRDSLWAYARRQNDVAVLFIASLESAMEPVRHTQARISELFDQTIDTLRWGWIACVLVAVVLAFVFSGKVTRPVRRLSSAMRRLGAGEFDVRVDVSGHDEFAEMAETFNALAPQLEEHVRNNQSLEVARSIQQNLLPGEPPTMLGMELAGKCIYSDAVGGDYYDFVPMADGSVLAAIGDVSGHGIEAALLMTTARAVLRTKAGAQCVCGNEDSRRPEGAQSTEPYHAPSASCSEVPTGEERTSLQAGGIVSGDAAASANRHERMPGPASIVAEVNNRLAQDVRQSGRFMTMFLCSVRPGRLHWVRAGHPPPLLLCKGEDAPQSLRRGGLSLGVLSDEQYEEQILDIAPGSVLLAYSDGLVEACAPDGERFGEERLRLAMSRCAGRSAQDTLDCVVAEFKAFVGETHLDDDVTIVVIRRED